MDARLNPPDADQDLLTQPDPCEACGAEPCLCDAIADGQFCTPCWDNEGELVPQAGIGWDNAPTCAACLRDQDKGVA